MLYITNIESIKKFNKIIFDNFEIVKKKLTKFNYFIENVSKIHIIMFF